MMRGTLSFAGAALLVALSVRPGSAQTTVAGTWDLTIDAPTGATTSTLELKEDAGALTGTLGNAVGSVPVSGKSGSGPATWAADIEIQGMAIHLDFTGAVQSDVLSGDVKAGDFGTFPFRATRAGDKSAAPATAAAAAPPAASAAAATAGSVTGTWDIVFTIEGMGEVPATATLTQDGQTVGGEITSMAGAVKVSGKITGASLTLDFVAETPQGNIPITMTGDLSGNALSGKASLAGMAEAVWKATRK